MPKDHPISEGDPKGRRAGCPPPTLKGWYRRGEQHPPHFDAGAVPQFVTFRLAGTLPRTKLMNWKELLRRGRITDEEFHRHIESYLDAGRGTCWLRDERIAELTQNAVRCFDGERYRLHGWAVMPNHVHVLFTSVDGYSLARIVGSWKSYTSNHANSLLQRTGTFWQDDYFDRYMRDMEDFESTLWYISHNPVAAGLCRHAEDWPYSHASAK